VCFGCCYEPTHNFSIDWAMGYIYFIIDLPSALVWDRRKKNADAVFGKASETVAGRYLSPQKPKSSSSSHWSSSSSVGSSAKQKCDRLSLLLFWSVQVLIFTCTSGFGDFA